VCGAEGNSKKGWERVAAKQEKETRSRADELERGRSRAWVEGGGPRVARRWKWWCVAEVFS
jgi:hypothetical protein